MENDGEEAIIAIEAFNGLIEDDQHLRKQAKYNLPVLQLYFALLLRY